MTAAVVILRRLWFPQEVDRYLWPEAGLERQRPARHTPRPRALSEQPSRDQALGSRPMPEVMADR
jgi:hypothetical protein